MATTTSVEFVKEVLTETEQVEAQPHERIVDDFLAGYVEIGAALKNLRDRHLYVGRFEDYTLERFEIARGTALRRIKAASVALNLKGAGMNIPANEAQAYELQDLEPEAQIKTWKKVLDGREERSADHHRSDPEGAGEEDAAPSGESAGRVPH